MISAAAVVVVVVVVVVVARVVAVLVSVEEDRRGAGRVLSAPLLPCVGVCSLRRGRYALVSQIQQGTNQHMPY